ncbi:MAG: arginine-ornithine antiporter [Mesorhizobium sp.]|uniref:arginine-ornithine antiporter n=1 Tax=unclassified Mesorhizobium TaxID=325217 RepID=UPI000FCBF97D|nr:MULTISPECIES: arginine-ornithine antiporter [unclassified Mesorhizobium]RUV74831.1 arginine-ornithine antiporter [Mesorhizobium sp. M5C.F.Cr.IN.023.01.1.1]RWF88662.1 MAG: arginine-ornithine antiporter [Mesorhizobium sp.]RWF92947.1 MAG: arginine-ornithine antiporter [Mesorhizobium sp.]RWI41270.1 MAG: arginine-ornithine antiporter [Mesorhizobium sp.]RWI49737.1 MAG: arginine-ornithine antiporter [Mesorhizobium sp.]
MAITQLDASVTRVTKIAAQDKKLRLGALTALVIGSMVGSGVFSLPQNMAAGAGPLAIMIGWGITAIGMLALVFVYQSLATRKPDLDAGPYAYAKAGFGAFVGFNSAWGYWLSAWIGNVSYAVIVFSALSYFFPSFGDGNTWQAVLGASLLLWLVHFLILAGLRQAALTNLVVTIAKVAPIVLFIGIAAVAFKLQVWTLDFAGAGNVDLGSVTDQVKSTMMVTLWVFIGIEGASVFSARAERRKDVAVATVIGFAVCLALYALVSLLSLGIISQPELAALKNPSMAGVLEALVGPWGAVLINIALVVSVLGAFLAWTMLAAEIPHVAAKDGTMPSFFARESERGVPSTSLLITNLLVQGFLIVTLYAQSTYQALFYIASAAILVPYIFSGAYAAKLAITGESYGTGDNRAWPMLVGLLATAYGLWLVYAAGPVYLFMCAVLYAPGVLFYVWARREGGERVFHPIEAVIAAVLVAVGLFAAYQMWTGAVSAL